MFVLRFIKHGGNGYKSFSCDEYEVSSVEGSDAVEVKMITHAAEQPDDGETLSEAVFERVGSTEPYDLAYVTNRDGKTIDTVRHRLSAKRAP